MEERVGEPRHRLLDVVDSAVDYFGIHMVRKGLNETALYRSLCPEHSQVVVKALSWGYEYGVS